jgi:GTP pyrophosphokinase
VNRIGLEALRLNRLENIIALTESYLTKEEILSIKKAYFIAQKAHKGQKRLSGESYFTHAEEVGFILADMGLDAVTIVSGLLHDTIEDTNLTKEAIEKDCGPEVAAVVEGVTKLSKVSLKSERTQQIKNYCKLLLALSTDIRVVFVKLADRLHNMRTIGEHDADKRYKISHETLNVFTTLADIVGMNKVKNELETLSFEQINPNEKKVIERRLDELEKENKKTINNVVLAIKSLLKNTFFEFEVTGRLKSSYSIWEKMRRRSFNLLQISDIIAIRVVVESIEDCYHALGIVHSRYAAIQGKFKDYISVPKRNNYQSIHTIVTIAKPCNQQIEIQIRTKEMDEVAEYGIAAHWNYKKKIGSIENFNNYGWMRNFLSNVNRKFPMMYSGENSKGDLLGTEIFCFTPNGDIITLAKEATVLDFAYAIHTLVGHTCVGAKVNGVPVISSKELLNGDTVEISTSFFQKPSPSWLSKVITRKAKNNIKKFLKSRECEKYRGLGKSMAIEAAKESGLVFSEKNVEDYLVKSLSCNSSDDLYIKVGQCFITTHKLKLLFKQYKLNKTNKRQANNNVNIVCHNEDWQAITVQADEHRKLLYDIVNTLCECDVDIISMQTELIEDNMIYISFAIRRIGIQQIQEVTKTIASIKGVIEVKDVP